MFLLSKLVWMMLEPGNALVLLLLLAAALLLLGRQVAARRLVMVLAVTCGLTAFSPLWSVLELVLEDRFPVPASLPEHVDGVVVLGGALRPASSQLHGQPELNEAAERVTMLVALARRYPDAQLVFSGGNGSIQQDNPTEAAEMPALLESLGVPAGRVRMESGSRNTFENAVMSRDLVKPAVGSTWLLVTTSWHMPRAVGVFHHAGWVVVPLPVDHLQAGGARAPWSFLAGLQLWSVAWKEALGLVAYRVLGRTGELFPGP